MVSCVTMPICARSEASVTSRTSTPSIRMPPPVTSKNRGTRFIIVVLPAPLRPTSATTWPRETVKLTPLRIGLAWSS